MQDVFGKNTEELKKKKLFLFDMDGTLYNGDLLFEGSKELLDHLKKSGRRYFYITNNSSRSANAYVEKLGRLGIPALRDEVFSSIDATIVLLKEYYRNDLIYVQGTRSFLEELRENGLHITEEYDEKIAVVLTGYDTELNYQKLINTCKILTLHDVAYYATNPDWVCPCEFGFIPDNGSVAWMIEKATGKRPIFIGKPEKTMIELVLQKTGISKEETLVIGDRLYTDIASGRNAGVTTLCVLSGETTLEDIVKEEERPDYTLNSVRDLYRLLKEE